MGRTLIMLGPKNGGRSSGVSSYTYSATVISLNVATLSATLNGTNDQALHYVPAIFPEYNRTHG